MEGKLMSDFFWETSNTATRLEENTAEGQFEEVVFEANEIAKDTIGAYVKKINIGKLQTYMNLAILPVLSRDEISLHYLTLNEAFSQETIEIGEVSPRGRVRKLLAINNSPQPVLILTGEELVGAKQNRIVNTTILIDGYSDLTIPVSCVEQGRWSYHSRLFRSENRMMTPRMRSLMAERVSYTTGGKVGYRKIQSRIWREISAMARRRKAVSSSMAMSDIYKTEKPLILEYLKHFHPVDDQVGAIFMINGRISGMDAFGKSDTFYKVFKKLIGGYSLEAIDCFRPHRTPREPQSQVDRFLADILIVSVTKQPSPGIGNDLRLWSDSLIGSGLEIDKQMIQFSVFTKISESHGWDLRSRIQELLET